METQADSQVWNFPAFAYSRTTTPLADRSENVQTTVWYTNPEFNKVGTSYFAKTYTYTLKAGTSGRWTGASVNDHPDFAWVPTGKAASSHIREAVVEEIIGQDV